MYIALSSAWDLSHHVSFLMHPNADSGNGKKRYFIVDTNAAKFMFDFKHQLLMAAHEIGKMVMDEFNRRYGNVSSGVLR